MTGLRIKSFFFCWAKKSRLYIFLFPSFVISVSLFPHFDHLFNLCMPFFFIIDICRSLFLIDVCLFCFMVNPALTSRITSKMYQPFCRFYCLRTDKDSTNHHYFFSQLFTRPRRMSMNRTSKDCMSTSMFLGTRGNAGNICEIW